ncbi:MAG: NAD-dependent epimerase/dehydratase family protein, partial [Alphaproteobacteria bacterium]
MEDECILITGGAGYIGSHAIFGFQSVGYKPIVIDNLATGVRQAVPENVTFIEGNAGDQSLVQSIIQTNHIKVVVHFAGSVVVPESVTNPLKYYSNNTCVSRNLLDVCVRTGVKHFIY